MLPSTGVALFPQYDPARYRSLAALAESLGYSHAWVPDERFFHDLAVSMTQVALSTTTITVGSAVTDPYIRHPALTAQMMASLDAASDGRLVVGIGSGLAGFKALGLKSDRPVAAIREAIDIMRALWTGEVVDYHGTVFDFNESRLDVTPIRPRIPVWVAGRGPSVLRLAGRIADGAMIGSLSSPAGLAYAFEQLDAGLSAARRSRSGLTIAIWLHTAIALDGRQARDAVRPIVANALSSSRAVLDDIGLTLSDHIRDALAHLEHDLASPQMARFAAMLDDETLSHFTVAGTPKEVEVELHRLRTSGVDHIALVPWLVPGQTPEEFMEMCARLVDTHGHLP